MILLILAILSTARPQRSEDGRSEGLADQHLLLLTGLLGAALLSSLPLPF